LFVKIAGENMAKKGFGRTNADGAVLGLEQTLWLTADKLQKNIGTAFKNNDQLKTNTSLQMDAAKIEFKVI
jgi:hypothetical protein